MVKIVIDKKRAPLREKTKNLANLSRQIMKGIEDRVKDGDGIADGVILINSCTGKARIYVLSESNLIDVNHPMYMDLALNLAYAFEDATGEEFTIKKDYF